MAERFGKYWAIFIKKTWFSMKKGFQKKNKYAHLTQPQVEFDYHGLDPFLGKTGIQNLTREKMIEFKNAGNSVVRLIVGKGLHSKNGAVIKPIVLELLQEMKLNGEIKDYNFDSSFGVGPNQGAVVVKV